MGRFEFQSMTIFRIGAALQYLKVILKHSLAQPDVVLDLNVSTTVQGGGG